MRGIPDRRPPRDARLRAQEAIAILVAEFSVATIAESSIGCAVTVASAAFNTALQAGGSCYSSVIGGFRFRRYFWRLGMEHRIAEPVGEVAGAAAFVFADFEGWVSHSLFPGGHLMRMWK